MKTSFNHSNAIGLVTLFLFTAIIFSGCSKDSLPGPNEVWMRSTTFTPNTTTVPVNTTIKWINKEGVTHNVRSNTGLFGSEDMENSETYSFKFTAKGSFGYNCTLHPGMKGTVVVQ